jgi:hypothetical protein
MRSNTVLALFLIGLCGCPKPTAKQPTTTPSTKTKTSTQSLQALMKLAGEASVRASASLSDPVAFTTATKEVAASLLTTRDVYSSDPSFYQLADESLRAVSESVAASSMETRQSSWTKAQKTCQGCHLRYGGPASEATALVDSLTRSNP